MSCKLTHTDPLKRPFFIYRAPINNPAWGGREIPLFLERGKVCGHLFFQGTHHCLQVSGSPPLSTHTLKQIKKFFSCAYLAVQKAEDGLPCRLEVRRKALGGVTGEQHILPVRPGLTLGSLVRKSEIKLGELSRQAEILCKEIEDLKAKIDDLKVTHKEAVQGVDQPQLSLNLMTMKLVEKEDEYKEVWELFENYHQKIREDETLKKQHLSRFNVDLMLPIDYKLTHIMYVDKGFYSEVLDHLLFTVEESDSKRGDLIKRVQSFVNGLYSKSFSSTFISSDALEGICDAIIQHSKKTKAVVSLVGSFVTLPKVRMLHPIVFQKNAHFQRKLLEASKKDYVLSEAALGGLFLAIGKQLVTVEDKPGQAVGAKATKEVMTDFAVATFIGLGAVPNTSAKDSAIPNKSEKPDDINLWSIYLSWKNELLNKGGSGFPVGFRYRRLKDLFKENGIKIEKDGNKKDKDGKVEAEKGDSDESDEELS